MMTCGVCGVRLKCSCSFDLKSKAINGNYPCKKCAGIAKCEQEFSITLAQKEQNVNIPVDTEQNRESSRS